jgi:energy-coupling factor transport system substrate-specific component
LSWQLAGTLLVVAALACGLGWYERSRPSSKLVALVAALAAVAVAGRVVFAPIPNVQATTDVVLLSGYCLGAAPGFAIGAVAALASNVFLGQGPWTPWQMLGWGTLGAGGAVLAALCGRRLGRSSLALACGLSGLAFGAWMDLFTLTTFAAEGSARGYVVIAGASLPFNVAHALGNVLLCLVFGPGFVRMLARFRRRLEVRWLPASASGNVALLALGAVLLLGLVPPPAAEAGISAGVRYLERAQNGDGGFGGAPRQASSQLITGWTVIGLEAAGRHPLDVRSSGRSPIGFMRAGSRALNDTGELERTIIALRGAGRSPRRFAGRDLVAELLRRQRPDGSFDRQSTLTAFGIIALRAEGRGARSPSVRRAARWLARQQNPDGGFSFATRGGTSFVDETGAALQGLAAAAKERGGTARAAVSFFRRAQNEDGGFGQSKGYRSNAQSTAWVAQGLVAAGRDLRALRRKAPSPLRYLASLQGDDGSFRYSRTSSQTPVWVTAQVLAALARKPLPLRPPKRARRSSATQPAAPATRRKVERRSRHSNAPRRASSPARSGHRGAATNVNRLDRQVATRPAAQVPAQRRQSGADEGVPAVALVAGIALGAGAALWLARTRLR